MASTSTEPFGVKVNMILTPVKTSEDDESITTEDENITPEDDVIQIVEMTSIAYFPDGQRMMSGSWDKAARRWDLQSGKEIEEARDVCEEKIWAVAVSRDGRWVVTAGGDYNCAELKACEVETGILKRFQGHTRRITCIDISADSRLLVSGSDDFTARIWNLDRGQLVAGPFKSIDDVGAVRFSPDSKKLAVKLWSGRCLEVWDIQSQKLDARVGEYDVNAEQDNLCYGTILPVYWTNKNKSILAAFSFTCTDPKYYKPRTIYEFDASTLKTVGVPFEGHTKLVTAFVLLFDDAFLISASDDCTVKLWAFESRQLLASFDGDGSVQTLISSPDSLQIAYTFYNNPYVYICNATPALLAMPGIQSIIPKTDATLQHLLSSDATRRPAVVRRTSAKRPVISSPPRHQFYSPTIDHQQPMFLRHVRKLFHFTSHANTVRPVQPRDSWDFPATSPLPPNRSASPQAATQLDHFEISSLPRRSKGIMPLLRQGISFRRSGPKSEPPVVEVPPGRKFTRLAAAKLPEYRKVDDTRHPSRQQTTVPQGDPSSDLSDIDSLPDVHWLKALLCYSSCWSHGRLRTPPRWRLERVDSPR